MKGICVNFLDLDIFFDSFREVAMATDFWQNLQSDLYSTCWHFATDSNIAIRLGGNKLHNFFSTFCAILMMIGPLTAKFSHEVSVPFGTRRQKSIYHTKYLSKYWTKLHQLFRIGSIMYADYKTEIIFAVIEETLLW